MFAALANPKKAYGDVGTEIGVSTADSHRLILMLFDGALMAVSSAVVAMERNDIEARAQAVTRAIEIISNGLKVSLDRSSGGDLADRLAGLYDYICARLLYASLHQNPAALQEAMQLLGELKEAWQGIRAQDNPDHPNQSV